MNRLGEEAVTRILSQKEILRPVVSTFGPRIKNKLMFVPSPRYDLSAFLTNLKPEPGRFGNKYMFVK